MGTDRGHNSRSLESDTALWSAASRLLASLGISGSLRATPLTGGANNRAYRLSACGRQFLLKHYFSHNADKRNRLAAEFAFCSFAHSNSLRCVPRPLARDQRARIALYEYIPGRRILPGAVTLQLVRQSLDFFQALNRLRNSPHAAGLPAASEACFSLNQHLRRVSERVRRLAAAEDTSPAGRQASALARRQLLPLWKAVTGAIVKQAKKHGIDPAAELAQEDRCISPSDFGFHNAILPAGGRLKFIDFEYAGWDDPAKTVNDFFCQLAVPVPMEYYPAFLKAVVRSMKDARHHAARIPILLPAYRVKWCCILLNCFLPEGAQRRAFAAGDSGQSGQKELQLKKAAVQLNTLAAQLRSGNIFTG